MEIVFKKINRRSKPIKKQERVIYDNLKRRNINLEDEDFNILQMLY